MLSAFRKRRKELLQRICFLEAGMLTWHGIQPKKPCWQSSDSNFLAVSIHSQAKESESRVQTFGDLYLAFNAHPSRVLATIPEPPQNMTWVRIADSSFPYPDNFLLEGTHLEFPSPDGRYNFQPYSSVVLEARPVTQWHDPTGSAWFIWQNLLQLVITVSVTASKPTNLQKDHLQLEATRSIVHGRNLKGLQRKASAKRWEPGTTTKCSRC